VRSGLERERERERERAKKKKKEGIKEKKSKNWYEKFIRAVTPQPY